ncbi:MAG: hypothetical protein Kow00127_05800 [Bacteroidales bacterium]
MKPIIQIFTALFLLTSPVCEAQTGQLPGSDALFEKIRMEWTLNPDGSQEYHFYKRLKLLTHYSFNRLYGETFITYNPQFQTLDIGEVKTTHSDGKVFYAPVNAFNEVLPRSAADAPAYNHLREMVLTHPGTEIGATLEADYTITTKAGYLPALMGDIMLLQDDPVSEREIIIRVPENAQLNYKVFHLRTSPEISTKKGFTTYRFVFRLPGIRSFEHYQQPFGTHEPRLVFSTVSWDEFVNLLKSEINSATVTGKQLPELAKQVSEKFPDHRDRMLALQKIVAEEMVHYGVSLAEAGYKFRSPDQVWQSNGGTELERAILLAELLRMAGIDAEAVLAVPSTLYDNSIALPSAAKALVRATPRDHEQTYMQTENLQKQNEIFRLNGYTILSLHPRKSQIDRISEQFANKVITKGAMKLSEDGLLQGNFEILLSEAANPCYALAEDTSLVNSFITRIPGARFSSPEIINNAQYRSLTSVSVESSGAFRQQGDYLFFTLPENSMGTVKWGIHYLPDSRETSLSVPFPVDEEYSLTLTVPDGHKLINTLPVVEQTYPFGTLVISITQEGNEITVKRLFMVTADTISPQDYNLFKQALDLWNDGWKRQLVIRKPAG